MLRREWFKNRLGLIIAWGVFGILLLTYWLTVPPTVSYWDCPEYVAGAWLLEIGHPPGNPVWMLVERVITMLAPSGEYAALLVNLSSGLFTAFAGFFLALTIYAAAGWVIGGRPPTRWPLLQRSIAAITGSLAFGWCDSTWYSAVEAEVYAMSIFMTSLCVWLMMKWAFCHDPGRSTRLLILLAYLFGLSIGIHQLNLLCIPALAIIWSIKRGVRSVFNIILVFILSLGIVGGVLVGMMPSTIALGAELELLVVNTLGLPYLWGVGVYVILLAISLLLALVVTARSTNRGVLAAAIFPALYLSGIFIFADNFLVGAALTAIVCLLIINGLHFSPRRLNICVWMLTMLLTGYSAYAIIPLRGDIPSPANATLPGEPFSFAAYQAREQYGGAPLLYGHTPFSKILLHEDMNSEGKPSYTRTVLIPEHPIRIRKSGTPLLRDPYKILTPEDSVENHKALAKDEAYLIKGYKLRPHLTPELNMWLPRITSRDPEDLRCYGDWAGMDTTNMTKVEITEALDSCGEFVTKINGKGERAKAESYRPTYLQSLRMFLTYQCGYMYFRYLLWNFSGRQNDIHSTGEVEHGNFITGFPILDNAMLGAEDALPPDAGKDNKGRNRYFMLPLLLGIIGIIWLLFAGKRGWKTECVIFMLFIMTGLAIVVYLNQSPGEPRERDYSFLGSYMAYAVWIGFGALAFLRLFGKWAPVATLLPLFTVGLMLHENFDDHDRSGRMVATRLAENLLNSLEPDAIIFVNGDNTTFPLWYVTEVEGLRPDVRVINLAYLGVPEYAAALMRDWREAKSIPTTLKPDEILYNGVTFARIGTNKDSIPYATDMIRSLTESGKATTEVSYVLLQVPGKEDIKYPLKNLSRNRYGNVMEFRNLILFDILATNAASDTPRPIYWQRSLPSKTMIGLDSLFTPGLLANRFGISDITRRHAEYMEGVRHLLPPNAKPEGVYMDAVPAAHISAQRSGLIIAARDLLDNGELKDACRIAILADSLYGSDFRSYAAVKSGDSIFRVRYELASLLDDVADSLILSPRDKRNDTIEKLKSRAKELREIDEKNLQQWTRYKRTLPPYLRLKMTR